VSLRGGGIGPGVLSPVLEQYALRLVPRAKKAVPVKEIGGVGPKRSNIIEKMLGDEAMVKIVDCLQDRLISHSQQKQGGR